jgi:hypothetical protein
VTRAVLVEPERLPGWLGRFAQRPGGVARTEARDDGMVLHAADGAGAKVTVPFAPIARTAGVQPALTVDDVVRHLQTPRRVALLLVRLGGHSVGVAQDGKVLISATGRRPVHARHRAGGSSSSRFARRRDGQARVALHAAADTAARVLVPLLSTVDAVVLGGDRRALATLWADSRLTDLFSRAEPDVLDVPEPRRSVLDEAARRVRCAKVEVVEPPRQPAVTA